MAATCLRSTRDGERFRWLSPSAAPSGSPFERRLHHQRLAAHAAGKKAQPYSAWLYQQRLRMVAVAAGAVPAAGSPFGELPGDC
jgi:hypothetical protein